MERALADVSVRHACTFGLVWVTHTCKYGYTCFVKTTLDLSDDLLNRAKRYARKTGQPLRALVEEGLRLALKAQTAPAPQFKLADRSVGDRRGENPLDALSWQDLRAEIYGGR